MTDCFECMDPANYAAVALKLQETALSAESCLFEVERSLRHAANLPTIIKTSSATQNTVSGITSTLNTTTSPITFANSEYVMGTANGVQVVPAGVWNVGCYINAIATGVVDDNTTRQLSAVLRRPFAPTSEADKYRASVTTYEPNVGTGVDMLLCTTIVADGTSVLQFVFLHGNTSSSLNISAGAIFWAHRLSDQIALKAV